MTPGARVAAAIEVLDRILAGEPAEKVLTQWGRDNRFAGSGDRVAIRDHVFDALRRRRSYAAAGGAETGRGIMIGALRSSGRDPAEVFSGAGHAPPPLTEAEAGHAPTDPLPLPVGCDVPDWLWPLMQDGLGTMAVPALMALRDRAGVHLRVNLRKSDREAAIAALAADGITALPHPEVGTALVVTANERKLSSSRAYTDGLVELQDAASQAAVLRLPLRDGDRVLDYCAGGGGKSLAMGALAQISLVAHDADPGRMADLPARADRAGLKARLVTTAALAGLGPMDLVLVDAPCSGSGTWRRAPDAKWRMTPDSLTRLMELQAVIMDRAADLVGPEGYLAYATCSILTGENRAQVDRFLETHPGWTKTAEMQLLPDLFHDGFYLAVLGRDSLQL
ncbi:MAG: RsmB/NOP family class I SAM-dependent RNA methyltransferase [Rhodobacterales bacterium]|nr:RsmB/NOP family class I SAM-dependent RNA methyltransferase [Rhodobacterales bacterium]